jgi:hypothetical protein
MILPLHAKTLTSPHLFLLVDIVAAKLHTVYHHISKIPVSPSVVEMLPLSSRLVPDGLLLDLPHQLSGFLHDVE